MECQHGRQVAVALNERACVHACVETTVYSRAAWAPPFIYKKEKAVPSLKSREVEEAVGGRGGEGMFSYRFARDECECVSVRCFVCFGAYATHSPISTNGSPSTDHNTTMTAETTTTTRCAFMPYFMLYKNISEILVTESSAEKGRR